MRQKEKDHLPLYGVGPIYAATVVILTVATVLLRNQPIFRAGKIEGFRILFIAAGTLQIMAGAFIWIQAVVISKVDDNIVKNQLVTTGIYAWVRNPIYSAFMIICTGVLVIVGNWYFFILPLLYWIFMTVLMKNTEEKWLRKQYGKEYEEYCRRVNRCWPWFPRR